MELKKSLLITIILSIILLTSWEFYLRSLDVTATIQDDESLWASQRRRVDQLEKDDFIFMGSSRIHFDFQLDVWEQVTGKRPIQLAIPGSSPLPVFRDIVRNSDFTGTVVVGVTPPLFFSSTFPQAPPISSSQKKVDYYHDQTYAQRLNQWLSLPLQKNLAMVESHDKTLVGKYDLQSLLKSIKIGNRTGKTPMPPFYEFGESSEDRNVRMLDICARDTSFAQTVIDVWMFFMNDESLPPPDKEATIAFFLEDLEIFRKRGGKTILLRAPSSDGFRTIETNMTPRISFWDSLVIKSNLPAYHFEDYVQFSKLHPPEWSHLSAEDADFFSKELIGIMLNDGVLTYQKTK